jgi:uncharacterized protein YdhG (YjbR/CyaY superfamily)
MNPIDLYIADIEDQKEWEALEDLRKTLHELLPWAIECISYGIPTLKVGGKWVAGFAKYKNHLSFFPFSGSIFEQFPEEMKEYEHTKSSLHFTPEKPIPREFLEKMMKKRLNTVTLAFLENQI